MLHMQARLPYQFLDKKKMNKRKSYFVRYVIYLCMYSMYVCMYVYFYVYDYMYVVLFMLECFLHDYIHTLLRYMQIHAYYYVLIYKWMYVCMFMCLPSTKPKMDTTSPTRHMHTYSKLFRFLPDLNKVPIRRSIPKWTIITPAIYIHTYMY